MIQRLALLEEEWPRNMEDLLNRPLHHLSRLQSSLKDLLFVTPSNHPDVSHLQQAIQILRATQAG